MLTYDEIIHFCAENPHALIYLSIGCAQNGNPVSNEQQVPPFVRSWTDSGQILLILIDPALESPPQALKDIEAPCTESIDSPVISHGRYDVIALRQNFEWTNDTEKSFIDSLCALALNPANQTHVIVQDFSGINIHKYYPLAEFGPELMDRVIFDVTHEDGTCQAPWAHGQQPQFLNTQTGTFVHAWHQLLKDIRPYVSERIYEKQKGGRTYILSSYVHRLYHIQRGTEPVRDWCTPTHVLENAETLFELYEIYPGTHNQLLLYVLVAGFKDIVGSEHSNADIVELINAPYGEYGKALRAAYINRPVH